MAGVGNIDLRGEHPIIWKLDVVPGAPGAGIGSALLRVLVGWAGGRAVRLGYLDGNASAAAFYATHGFVEVGREADGQPGRPEIERRPAEW